METAWHALIGALMFIVLQLFFEKQKRDKDPNANKESWGTYFAKSWDDFLFAIICAAFLGYKQEEFVYALIHWREWDPDKTWDIYYDTEFFISSGLGMFGTIIIQQMWKLGIKLLSKTS